MGLKRSQTKPKTPGTVPTDRHTTIPNDSGPISACFDDDPKLLHCEIAQPRFRDDLVGDAESGTPGPFGAAVGLQQHRTKLRVPVKGSRAEGSRKLTAQIVRCWGSRRPPASGKPIRKGFPEAGVRFEPQNRAIWGSLRRSSPLRVPENWRREARPGGPEVHGAIGAIRCTPPVGSKRPRAPGPPGRVIPQSKDIFGSRGPPVSVAQHSNCQRQRSPKGARSVFVGHVVFGGLGTPRF